MTEKTANWIVRLFSLMFLILILWGFGSCISKQDNKIHVTQGQYIEYACANNPQPDKQYVKNISNQIIKVKCVWQGKGETTQFIRILQPQESFYTKLHPANAFYVLNPKTDIMMEFVQ